MPRTCSLHPSAPVKGNAYARKADGSLERMTRAMLLAGEFPPGTVEVLTGVHGAPPQGGELPPGVICLTPDEATAATRSKSRAAEVRQNAATRETTMSLSPGPGQQPIPHACRAVVHTVGETKVMFGVPAELGWGDDVEVLPRNPYVLSGHDATTDEGRQVGLQYTAALAAVHVATCYTCGSALTCALCRNDPSIDQRREVLGLLGNPGNTVDSTVVDALLLASTQGDVGASASFKTLAALGEQMVAIEQARRVPEFTNEQIATAMAMSDAEFDSWYRERLSSYDSAIREWDGRLNELISRSFSGEITQDELAAGQAEASRVTTKLASARSQVVGVAAMREDPDVRGMSTDDLYLVHETGHTLIRDESGDVLLYPLEHFDPEYHRTSVHFAINNVVSGHMFRPSPEEGSVVVIKLNDFLAANPDTLENLYVIDSFFSPPPGQPLRLPAEVVEVVEFGAGSTVDRESAVHAVLTERGAPTFSMGMHYSSPGPDALVSHYARTLGASSSLHANLPSVNYELAFGQSATLPPLPVTAFTPETLALSSSSHRLRMVNHDDWGSVQTYIPLDPSEVVSASGAIAAS